jgi:hypothetical protein
MKLIAIMAVAAVLLPLLSVVAVTDVNQNVITQSYMAQIIQSDDTFDIEMGITTAKRGDANASGGSTDINNPTDIESTIKTYKGSTLSAGDRIYEVILREKFNNSAPQGSKWSVTLLRDKQQVGNIVYIGNNPANDSKEGIRIIWKVDNTTFDDALIEVIVRKLS